MIRALIAACCLLLAACGDPDVGAFRPDEYPLKLSAWGVVIADGERLRLGKSVVPYDLATPLYTDHAHKLRTVWIPAGSKARFDERDLFDFPVGTIISKTFYYPRGSNASAVALTDDHGADFAGAELDLSAVRLIETRLLVRQAHGWDALPYVWDAAQQDAQLEIAGDVMLLATDGAALTYVVPTRNECASCHASDHTSGALQPIGMAARHLDKMYEHYADGPAAQLSTWLTRGLIDRIAPASPRNALWQAGAFDDLDNRARSYLDINCGHCHNEKGSADTSGLLLDRFATDQRAMGVCKPPIAAGRGSGGHSFSIVPGTASASILVYRMVSTDPGSMMPELGRTTAHDAGVALIERWVDSLPPNDCGRVIGS